MAVTINGTTGITTTGDYDAEDGDKILLGTDDDLQIYHDGSHSRIKNTTGYLILQSSTGILLKNDTDDENFIVANDDGSVELCHNGSKKLETISTGINVTGGVRLGGNNSANQIDDYEEGTFTPRLGGASNIGTYNVTGVGAYVKIGNMVTVTFHFYDKDLDNSADGAVYIDQMPFTSKNGSTVGGISDNFHTEKVDFMEDRRYTWYISGNDTKLKGLYSTDGSGWANWQVADFDTDGMYIEVQCSYMTE